MWNKYKIDIVFIMIMTELVHYLQIIWNQYGNNFGYIVRWEIGHVHHQYIEYITIKHIINNNLFNDYE